MQIRSIGIDLGKTTSHLVALNKQGKVVLKKKFSRKQLLVFTANLQTSLIGMRLAAERTSLARRCESKGMMCA